MSALVLDIMLLSISIPANAAIDESSIVGIWLFDEGAGSIAHDSSGNGNDAEFQGEPKWVDGKIGKALWLDGSKDYLTAPDSESLDVSGDKLSIVSWIHDDGTPSAGHIVRKLGDQDGQYIYTLRVHPTAPVVVIKTNGNDNRVVEGGTQLPTNEWIHLATVYDGQEIRVYVNGEVVLSGPAAGNIDQSDGELRIGRGDPAGYFLGTIDEVGVFASALSEEDLQKIMEMGLRQTFLSVEPVDKISTVWAEVKTAY
jgi:hypothetical protein